jgi:hypothetical protein
MSRQEPESEVVHSKTCRMRHRVGWLTPQLLSLWGWRTPEIPLKLVKQQATAPPPRRTACASSTRPLTMVSLSASKLAPDSLRAGEVIEYFSHAFVFGNMMGHRRGIVTSVDGDKGIRFPIDVDTGEPIPRAMMIKRVADRFGNPLTALWRKLRTYRLVSGTFEAETRASALNKALAGAVTAAVASVREALRGASEEIVPEIPQSSACSTPEPVPSSNQVLRPSTPTHSLAVPASGE